MRALYSLCFVPILLSGCVLEEMPETDDLEQPLPNCQIPFHASALGGICDDPWQPPPLPPSCASTCSVSSSCSTACYSGGSTTCGSYGECTNVRTFERSDRIKSGARMTTKLKYKLSTGKITGTTKLKNSDSVTGFTGGMMVAAVDEDLVPLYVTPLRKWGINPCAFSCPKTRTVSWSSTVPSSVRDDVAGIAILHKHTPTARFWFGAADILGDLNDVLRLLEVDNVWTLAIEIAAELAPRIGEANQSDLEEDIQDMLDWIDENVEML